MEEEGEGWNVKFGGERQRFHSDRKLIFTLPNLSSKENPSA